MERTKIPEITKKRVQVDEPKEEVIQLMAPEAPQPIYWKKIGRGTLVLNGRLIKPNQVFTATVEQIPVSFRDVIQPLNRIPVPEDKLQIVKSESMYSLKEAEEAGLWNIVDKQEKILNESPMSKDEATNLLKLL